MQNGGDGFIETRATRLHRRRARGGVGRSTTATAFPTCLLATPTGPRLFTNLGKGQFRDDTNRLPKEVAYNLTAAAWGDFDGDGKPDILLANGFHGLRLYKNIRRDAPKIVPPKFGDWHAIGIFRAANPADNFKTEFPVEKEKFTPKKDYKGKRNMPTEVGEEGLQGRRSRRSCRSRRELRNLRLSRDSKCRPRRTYRCRSARRIR